MTWCGDPTSCFSWTGIHLHALCPLWLLYWEADNCVVRRKLINRYLSMCMTCPFAFDLFSFFGLSRRGDFMWPCSLPWNSCLSSVQGFPGKLEEKTAWKRSVSSTQSDNEHTEHRATFSTTNEQENRKQSGIEIEKQQHITCIIYTVYYSIVYWWEIYMHLTRQRRANFQEIFHRNFVHVWTIQKCYIFASMNPKVPYFWPGKETCVGSTVLHPRSFMDLSTNAHRWFKLPTRFIHFTMAFW